MFLLVPSAQDDVESDSFQIECLKDGTWSNKIPICKSKDTFPYPANVLFLLKSFHANGSCPGRVESLTQRHQPSQRGYITLQSSFGLFLDNIIGQMPQAGDWCFYLGYSYNLICEPLCCLPVKERAGLALENWLCQVSLGQCGII